MKSRLQKWIYFCTTEYGCVVCRRQGVYTPADYHHLLSGGRRRGNFYGFGLCPTHHRSGSKRVISRDQNKRRFEEAYGSEDSMLAEVQVAYESR